MTLLFTSRPRVGVVAAVVVALAVGLSIAGCGVREKVKETVAYI